MNSLPISDQRMLLLMEYAVKNQIVDNEGDYWQKIGFPRTNVSNVRKGIQSFRVEYIIKACQLTSASADWVLGLDKNMFRDTKKKTAVQKLKEATEEIEQQLAVRSKPRSKPLKLLF